MWKKIIVSMLVIVALMVGLLGASYYYVKGKIYKDVADSQVEKSISSDVLEEDDDQVTYKEVDGITNVLLIGTDKRADLDGCRSDSMIIATLDNNNNKIKLTSLYRDALVYIPGHGEDKMNAAFELGGVKLLFQTIKKNYDIDINDYVVIDFSGFETVIDQLGGVEVNVKDYQLEELNKYIGESTGGNDCPVKKAGKQVLNGKQALAYARIRYGVGDDYERTERQREVVLKMAEKLKDTNPTKYFGIMSAMLDYLTTNIDPLEALNMAYTIYNFPTLNSEQISIPILDITEDMNYKDLGSVLVSDMDQNAEILNKFIYDDEMPNEKSYDYESLYDKIAEYQAENDSYKSYGSAEDNLGDYSNDINSNKNENEVQLWD